MTLKGFTESAFTYEGKTRSIYSCGRGGPGVVVIHEAPGITPFVARFGRLVADEGFTSVLPNLFGEPGKPASQTYVWKELARACLSKEFSCLAKRRSSPVTDWLRALCRHVHQSCGGRGVGAVGMCLTGNFALSLMIDKSVMAPVVSQPSLPFPITKAHRAAIGISGSELEIVKNRIATEEGCRVLGLRFTNDPLCRAERFETLRRQLGDGFEGVEMDSSPGNPYGIRETAHSVLTSELVLEDGHPTKEAFDRVLKMFRERLPAKDKDAGSSNGGKQID